MNHPPAYRQGYVGWKPIKEKTVTWLRYTSLNANLVLSWLVKY